MTRRRATRSTKSSAACATLSSRSRTRTDEALPQTSVNLPFAFVEPPGEPEPALPCRYGGGDFVIVGGDATVLSVFAAAACSIDLREHSRFELRPGDFYDLRDLVREVRSRPDLPRIASRRPISDLPPSRVRCGELRAPRISARSQVRAGRFEAAEPSVPSESEVALGRAALREMGPPIFAETEAGSWVLGPGVRR